MRVVNPSPEDEAVELDDLRHIYKKIDALELYAPQVVVPGWIAKCEDEKRRAIEKPYGIKRPDPVLTTVTEAILYGRKTPASDERKLANKKKGQEAAAAPKPATAFDFKVDLAQFNSTQAILLDKEGGAGKGEDGEKTPAEDTGKKSGRGRTTKVRVCMTP